MANENKYGGLPEFSGGGSVTSVGLNLGAGLSGSVNNPSTDAVINLDLVPNDIDGIVGQNILSYDPVNNIATDTVILDTALQNIYNAFVHGGTVFGADALATTNINISNPGTNTFDGTPLTNGQILFITDLYQTDHAECGLYTFNGSSSALTRAPSMSTWEDVVGSQIIVSPSTTYPTGSIWHATVSDGGTINVTPITFALMPNSVYVGGTGVTVSGDTISIGQNVSTSSNVTFNKVSLDTNFYLTLSGASADIVLDSLSAISYNRTTSTLMTSINGNILSSVTGDLTTFSSSTQNNVVSFKSAVTGPTAYTTTSFSILDGMSSDYWEFGIVGNGPGIIIGLGDLYITNGTKQFTFDTSGNLSVEGNFIGNLTGTASSATNAVNVATTANSTSTAFYLPFVAASTTSNQALNVAAGLSYNPSTSVLTTTTFSGALSGNATSATTATTATNATNVATTVNATAASFYLPFVATSTTSNQALNVDAGLSYNPSTDVLTTTTFSGALSGNATSATNLSGGITNNIPYQTSTNNTSFISTGTQYQVLQAGVAGLPAFGALNLAQAAAVTGILPNTNTTATSANTINTIVSRNASGNFSAGTITAALTGTASGNTTYTANNHGVVVSSATNAMTVITPDASTIKVLTSGGTTADPTWALPSGATSVATIQTTTAATFYPLFVASSTNGNQATNLGTGLTFNPSTNVLTTTTFSGALSGNATTATTATNATNVATTANVTAANFYLPFVAASTTSNQALQIDSGITYNPSTNVLTTTTFSGALSGNATTATTLQTARNIYGNSFNGSADLTQIIASTYGGTGNGFTKFAGAATSEKTYTLPNATCSILTTNAAVTVAQGGTGQTTYTNGQLLIGNTTGGTLAKATLTPTTNQVNVTNGAGTITLSLPQDIDTGATPTFAGMSLTNVGATASLAIRNSAQNVVFDMGRTSQEFITAVVNTAGNYATTANPGDVVIRNNVASADIIFATSTAVPTCTIASTGRVYCNQVDVSGGTGGPQLICAQTGSSVHQIDGFFRSGSNLRYHVLDTTRNHVWYAATSSTTSNTLLTLQGTGELILAGSTAEKATGTTWSNPSDIRLKQDIQEFTDGLNVALQLRPVTYRFNEFSQESTEEQHIGFIANEVEQHASYMVSQIVDEKLGLNDKKILDESALTKILLNCIKQLNGKIELLEARISKLE